MAYGVILEAEYLDGFVLNEQTQGDVSIAGVGNTFEDIRSGVLVALHGPLVRFSMMEEFATGNRADLDWLHDVPAGAEPFYERDMAFSTSDGVRSIYHRFGYRLDGEVVGVEVPTNTLARA